MLKRLILGALMALTFSGAASAQGISQRVADCDPSYPTRCVKPNADGSINVVGGGGGGTFNIANKATAAAPTYVEGSSANPLSSTLKGGLRIMPITAAGANIDLSSLNLGSLAGTAVAVNAGNASAGTQRVVIATDQPSFAISATQSGTWNITNVSGTVSLPTGASTAANQSTEITSLSSIDTKLSSQATAANQTTGNTSLSSIDTKLSSQATAAKQDTGNTSLASIDTKLTSPLTVNLPSGASTAAKQPALGTAGTPSADVISVQGVSGGTALPVTISTATTGGADSYTFEVAASDNHQNAKGTAGTVYAISGFSNHTAALFIRLYDAAAGFNGCNSATNLKWEGNIPGSATPTGSGFIHTFPPQGVAFASGIAVCVTGAFGNTNTTNATASVASVNIAYK